jgi:hypothetical protein
MFRNPNRADQLAQRTRKFLAARAVACPIHADPAPETDCKLYQRCKMNRKRIALIFEIEFKPL